MATVERTARPESRFVSLALATGTMLLAGALWTLGGGPVGVLFAVAIGFVTAASGSYYGVGLGHLAALGVTATPSLDGVIVLELASVAFLSTELVDSHPVRDAFVLVVGTAASLGLVTTLATVSGTLATAGAVVGVAVAVGYVLYRVGSWNSGLLSEGKS